MEIIRDLTHFQAETNMAVSIGNFDGVHLGHSAIVNRIVTLAKERGFKSALVTFDPHPMKFFGSGVKLLQPLDLKIRECEKLGVDKFFLLDFNKEMAGINPSVFVREFLLKTLKASFIVVGYDYRFGRNRRGTYEFLQTMGKKHGFTALRVPKVVVDDTTASSTNIRKALEDAKPEVATKLLGRYYSLIGEVVRGDGLATKIGFPTANINVKNELIPANGIYSSIVHIGERQFKGALYIGGRPTVDDAQHKRVEVHIFDLSENLYGSDIEVDVVDFIRGDIKFNSVDELVVQIAEDCKKIKVLFEGR
ncbi:MAG: riboflavin biosynthesis protein RibF [Denitrovibrio sp.]|nr:MAG: riboflavin biosynthesis protein RibF [Denitrovibrio sp.]